MFRYIFILLVFVSLSVFGQDNTTPVSFTLGDRDRLMRNEQKIDALRNEMNVRFESMQKNIDERFKSVNNQFHAVNVRIDDVKDLIVFVTTLLIFVLGAIMSLIGFVIYDRRTILRPFRKEQLELEEKFRAQSKEIKKLKDSLRNAGVL